MSDKELLAWMREALPWIKLLWIMLIIRANHATDNGEQHSVSADELRKDCLNQAAKLDQLIEKAEGLL